MLGDDDAMMVKIKEGIFLINVFIMAQHIILMCHDFHFFPSLSSVSH